MSKVRDLYPVEDVAPVVQPKPARPLPPTPPPLPRGLEAPPGMPEPPPPAPGRGTFCDGVEYFFARFSHVFASDPVAFNAALLDIKYAREQKRPPDMIEVAWTTTRFPWRAEVERLIGAGAGVNGLSAEHPPGRQGRPVKGTTVWSKW